MHVVGHVDVDVHLLVEVVGLVVDGLVVDVPVPAWVIVDVVEEVEEVDPPWSSS